MAVAVAACWLLAAGAAPVPASCICHFLIEAESANFHSAFGRLQSAGRAARVSGCSGFDGWLARSLARPCARADCQWLPYGRAGVAAGRGLCDSFVLLKCEIEYIEYRFTFIIHSSSGSYI